MTIFKEGDWYEPKEDNEQIASDEAWEEYMSTGIDPTGGEIGPDFDPKEGESQDELDEGELAFYREERAHPWTGVPRYVEPRLTPEEVRQAKKGENRWTLILIVFMAVLGILAIIF